MKIFVLRNAIIKDNEEQQMKIACKRRRAWQVANKDSMASLGHQIRNNTLPPTRQKYRLRKDNLKR